MSSLIPTDMSKKLRILEHLIYVYTLCSDMVVQILMVKTVIVEAVT